MDKSLELFDAWAKSQKEFLDSSLKAQEEFRLHWLDSMKKMQDSLTGMSASSTHPQQKELNTFFDTWFANMLKSSEVFSDEAVKVQKTWKSTLENQTELSRELVKNYSSLFSQTENK